MLCRHATNFVLRRTLLGQRDGALDAPADEALAKALRCDAQTLLEHRAALRTDVGLVLHLLTPVVAYFGDVALARQLQSDAEGAVPGLDPRNWLRSRFPGLELAAEDWLQACERPSDRAELRKTLDLDYERFNRTLLALGELPLSNEAELRSLYEAYRRQMGPGILDRLRRRHAADFREGRDLGVYVERKTLAFLAFDPAWIRTKVKSSLEDTGEFELTPNEMRVAAGVPRRGRRRYRILYVPFVFCPDRWLVLELPNLMGDATRNRFKQIGQGSVRFRFHHSTTERGS